VIVNKKVDNKEKLIKIRYIIFYYISIKINNNKLCI